MKFDDLNETFDVAGDIVEATKDVKVTKPLPERDKTEVRKDYEYTRGNLYSICLLYTSPSPRDGLLSRMPSSA